MAQFHRWYVRNLLAAIVIAWLWGRCLRAYERAELFFVRLQGPSNLHCEFLPGLVGLEADLQVQEPEDEYGIFVCRNLFNVRTDIEHQIHWRSDGSLSETILIKCRHHRPLYLKFVDGGLFERKHLDPVASLSPMLNKWEREGLDQFMACLHELSPIPKKRRTYQLVGMASSV